MGKLNRFHGMYKAKRRQYRRFEMHFEVVSAQKCVLECVKRVHLLPAFSHFGSDSNEACLRADDAAENHAYAHDADVAHLFIEEPEAADNARQLG